MLRLVFYLLMPISPRFRMHTWKLPLRIESAVIARRQRRIALRKSPFSAQIWTTYASGPAGDTTAGVAVVLVSTAKE